MTTNLDAEGYYSPQQMSTRLFHLDLQVSNLAMMVKKLYAEVHGDHAHIQQIDAMLADLQGQIRECRGLHGGQAEHTGQGRLVHQTNSSD